MNKILKNDFEEILNSKYVDWESFKNTRILITGSTGLIGSLIVKSILYANKVKGTNINLILPVRSKDKLLGILDDFYDEFINIIESDIVDFANISCKDIDYIIHGASPTHSKFFITKPVETVDTIVLGTRNILNIARKQKNLKSLVVLSSMEVYGEMTGDNISEKELGMVKLYSTRSSYPESKRLIELMSYCFNQEYKVPAIVARLAQSFGPGILSNENRVFKQFCDNILNGENITMKSTGDTIMNYVYTTDAIISILKLLVDGIPGESYNIVNNYHMTIKECAEWLSEEFMPTKGVKMEIDNKAGFAPSNQITLSNVKLSEIGYTPIHDIKYGYRQLLNYLKEEKHEK